MLVILLLVSLPLAEAIQNYPLDYDANGNLIHGFDQVYEYNSLNQLTKVWKITEADSDKNIKQMGSSDYFNPTPDETDYSELIDALNNKNPQSPTFDLGSKTATLSAEYFYDESSNRIKKIVYDENGEVEKTTYYVSQDYIVEVDANGTTHKSVYYYDEFSLVGRKDDNGKIYFYHPDHLGSTDIITDESGNLVEELSYMPFGSAVSETDERYQFTGQEKDKESNLMYYGARYYSPYLSRFTQADTILPNVYDPQQLNRYAYARNNPLKYTDPTGNVVVIPFFIFMAIYYVAPIVIGAAVGYAIGYTVGAASEGISQAYSNFGEQDGSFGEKLGGSFDDLDWGKINHEGNSVGIAGAITGGAEGLFQSLSLRSGGKSTSQAFKKTTNPFTNVEEDVPIPRYTQNSDKHIFSNHHDLNLFTKKSKFLPSESGGQSFADEVYSKVGKITVQPDGRYRLDADLGRVVGTKGQTGGAIVMEPSGEIVTQFPQKVK